MRCEVCRDMVGQAKSKRHHGKGGVGATSGREDSTTGNVKVIDAMEGKIAVDDAGGRIVAHAEASHRVIGVEHGGHGVVEDGLDPLTRSNVVRPKIFLDDVGVAGGRVLLGLADVPVDDSCGETEGVGVRGRDADTVVGVGDLLDVDVETQDSVLADGTATLEACVDEEAHHIAGAAKHGDKVGADCLLDAAALK